MEKKVKSKAEKTADKIEKTEKIEKTTTKSESKIVGARVTKAGPKSDRHHDETTIKKSSKKDVIDVEKAAVDKTSKNNKFSFDQKGKGYSRGGNWNNYGHNKYYRRKKFCMLCAKGIEHVDYKDVELLEKYLNQSLKIASRKITAACSTHQRRVSNAIKRARIVALIPFIKD